MFFCRNRIHQLLFRPAVFADCPDIPAHLLQCQAGLQNHHILRPADFHGLTQQGGAVFIGAVKLPHPAQVARGETGRLWVSRLQVFCSGDRSAFLGPAADDTADLAVQIHLRQILCHEAVKRGIHAAVVDFFSDVHSGSPFPASEPVCKVPSQRKKRQSCRAFLRYGRISFSPDPVPVRALCRHTAGHGSCPRTAPSPYPPAGGLCSRPTR